MEIWQKACIIHRLTWLDEHCESCKANIMNGIESNDKEPITTYATRLASAEAERKGIVSTLCTLGYDVQNTENGIEIVKK